MIANIRLRRVFAALTLAILCPPTHAFGQASVEHDIKRGTRPPEPINKFFGQHCFDCHSDNEPEAGLSLTGLSV